MISRYKRRGIRQYKGDFARVKRRFTPEEALDTLKEHAVSLADIGDDFIFMENVMPNEDAKIKLKAAMDDIDRAWTKIVYIQELFANSLGE